MALTQLPDPYKGLYQHAVDVAPLDGSDLPAPGYSDGLWVGGGGDLAVDTAGGESNVIFVGVPAGTLLPVRVTRVRNTGTTASGMLQVW